jgi:hypothetical protein
MDTDFPAALPKKPKTTEPNGLSVIALALAVLPPLTYCLTHLYMGRSSEMFRSFTDSAVRLQFYCTVTALAAVLLAGVAVGRRPELLPRIAFVVALVAFVFAWLLPFLFPLRIK